MLMTRSARTRVPGSHTDSAMTNFMERSFSGHEQNGRTHGAVAASRLVEERCPGYARDGREEGDSAMVAADKPKSDARNAALGDLREFIRQSETDGSLVR